MLANGPAVERGFSNELQTATASQSITSPASREDAGLAVALYLAVPSRVQIPDYSLAGSGVGRNSPITTTSTEPRTELSGGTRGLKPQLRVPVCQGEGKYDGMGGFGGVCILAHRRPNSVLAAGRVPCIHRSCGWRIGVHRPSSAGGVLWHCRWRVLWELQVENCRWRIASGDMELQVDLKLRV